MQCYAIKKLMDRTTVLQVDYWLAVLILFDFTIDDYFFYKLIIDIFK